MAAAQIKLVDSNKALLQAIRENGKRQTICFGHSLGFGALAPGGLSGPAVDPRDLDAAFIKGSATPIFIGCYSGAAPQVGERAPGGAVGLRRFLQWEDTDMDISSAGKKQKSLRADDITVNEIKLSPTGKPAAPQAPLPSRQATTPP